MTLPRDICCGRRPRRIEVGKDQGTALMLTYCGVCDTTQWFRNGELVHSPDVRGLTSEIAREVKSRRTPRGTAARR